MSAETHDAPPAATTTAFAPQAKWRERNPLKRWAHLATASAVNRGLITRQPCEVCGADQTDAHHDDYSRPMAVRWLCRKHHKDLHNLAEGKS